MLVLILYHQYKKLIFKNISLQTYRSVYIVYNVTQAGALVVGILALVILCTHFSHNIIFPLPWFIGMDDIPQHQHIVRRLALPRVGFGVHARTDAAYKRFELGSLEWRIVVDALDHVRRE